MLPYINAELSYCTAYCNFKSILHRIIVIAVSSCTVELRISYGVIAAHMGEISPRASLLTLSVRHTEGGAVRFDGCRQE